MSDTSPSELAAIIEDDKKYRTWHVLKLQEISSKLDNHISDDRRQFEELRGRVSNVSSSIGAFTGYKNRLQGGWLTLGILAAIFAFLIDVVLKIVELLK